MPSGELLKLKAHLRSLEDFMRSDGYVGYLAARAEEIRKCDKNIVDNEPLEREDEVQQWKWRGQRECLIEMQAVFEDAVEELRDRISDLEDAETNVEAPNGDKLRELDLQL